MGCHIKFSKRAFSIIQHIRVTLHENMTPWRPWCPSFYFAIIGPVRLKTCISLLQHSFTLVTCIDIISLRISVFRKHSQQKEVNPMADIDCIMIHSFKERKCSPYSSLKNKAFTFQFSLPTKYFYFSQ